MGDENQDVQEDEGNVEFVGSATEGVFGCYLGEGLGLLMLMLTDRQ